MRAGQLIRRFFFAAMALGASTQTLDLSEAPVMNENAKSTTMKSDMAEKGGRVFFAKAEKGDRLFKAAPAVDSARFNMPEVAASKKEIPQDVANYLNSLSAYDYNPYALPKIWSEEGDFEKQRETIIEDRIAFASPLTPLASAFQAVLTDPTRPFPIVAANDTVKKDNSANEKTITLGSCVYDQEVAGFYNGLIDGSDARATRVMEVLEEATRRYFPFGVKGVEIKTGSGDVRDMQMALIRLNAYPTVGRHFDGNYGPGTRAAVKRCQEQLSKAYANIEVTGDADPVFLRALATEATKHLMMTAHKTREVAIKYELNPQDFLLALYHESMGLNPHVDSGTGCVGLGQIAASTYSGAYSNGYFNEGLAQQLNFHEGPISRDKAILDLVNQDINLEASARYFKDAMRSRGTDNLIYIWATDYNLGAGNANKLSRYIKQGYASASHDGGLFSALKGNNLTNYSSGKAIPLKDVVGINMFRIKNPNAIAKMDMMMAYVDALQDVKHIEKPSYKLSYSSPGLY